ncbi:hypothetical protein HX890_29235 [Pseudomonas gingeri]|uniref:Ig-like domain-containing protein n=1 Tax=Pseudomonas gingeri TaxID=117681 RepID=UPI00159FF001|nr:Ig-like domain-containing protein [Pseudomonas gingeri]NWD78213.1 hypothetical protein [Pseudomonas gingeri]
MTRFMPLLLPPIDDSQTSLALRGLFIPSWVSPVADADFGINRSIVFNPLPNDVAKDALCIIDPWNGQAAGDHVDVYLDGSIIAEADVLAGEEDQRLFLLLPHDRITPDWGEDFHFKLTRVGSTQPDDESYPVRLRIKLDRPGGKDREPNNPGHSELKAPLPPANIIRDGVDAESARLGFDVEIQHYPGRAAQDTVQLAWGSTFVYRTITPGEAAGTDSIFIRVEQDTILAGGDSANLLVHYMVFDEVWNYAEKYSLRTYLKVDAGAAYLPAPFIPDAPNGVIDLAALGKKDVTVQIVAQAPDFVLNDTLEMIWTGTPVVGMPLINTQTTLLNNVPFVYEFKIPNSEIRAIAGGAGDVYYILRKADGTPPLSSRHAFASVVGEESLLPAPSIIELVGDTLMPDLPVATVVVHAYPGMKSGDFIQLVWLGEKANGVPYLHEDMHPVSENEEGTDITFAVDGEHIAALNGGTLDLYYHVSNDSAAVYDVRESDHLEVKVNSIVAQLPPPKVIEAPDNVLDPDLITGNATLLVDYLGTTPGDILTYYWHGNPGSGTASDWVPITTVTAGQPISFTLLRELIIANRDRMVQVRYTLKLAATGQYRYSGVLDLLIAREIVPTILSVKGQPGDFEIADGGTTVQTRVILSGDANKGLQVQVYDDGNPVGAPVTANNDGIWTLDMPNLGLGLHSMTATALYGSGASSGVRTFTVAVEVAPQINLSRTPSGEIPNGGTTVETRVILYGKATANTQVEILDGASSKGIFDVDLNGAWNSASIDMDTGTRIFTARTVGGTLVSAPWTLIVATEVKPEITLVRTPFGDVPDGGTTVQTSVVLYGTATANTRVELFDDIQSLGIFEVSGSRVWISASLDLGTGTHSFTARTVGGTLVSTPWTLIVATEVKPEINQAQAPSGDVANGGTTVETSVILYGTATANTQVEIFDGADSKGIFDVNSSSAWNSVSIDMGTGPHSFTARTVGGSLVSTPWIITVASEVKPQITQARTPSGEVPNGGTTVETRVILYGTATGNTQVEIFDGTTSKGTADVDPNGNWNSASIDMIADTHSFTAKTVGGTQTSTPWVITVATEVRPAINQAETPLGDVPNGGQTPARSVILHGTATANTQVEIFDGPDSKGIVDVNASSTWTSTSIDMGLGTHSFTARTVGGILISDPWVVNVAVEVKPFISRAETPSGDVPNGGDTVDTTVILHGTAAANTQVEIFDGNQSKGIANVNPSRIWTSASIAMTEGTHSFTAKTVGGVLTSDPWVVIVAAAVAPTIIDIRDSRGSVVGDITVETSVTVTGTGNSGQRIQLMDAGSNIGNPIAIPTGSINWSAPLAGLGPKAYRIKARALYGSGVPDSLEKDFDVTALLAPTLDNVQEPGGTEIPDKGSTTSTTLVLSGQASKGQKVEIFEGSGSTAQSKGQATADTMTGIWRLTITVDRGGRRLYAQSLYHSSTVYSNVRTLTVESGVAPTITAVKEPNGTAIISGGYTVSTSLTLSGKAANNQSVEIFDGNTSKGTAKASGNGDWSLAVTQLALTAHAFKAKALYDNNPESAVWEINVVASVQPEITSVKDPGGTEIPTGGYTTSTSITLSGTASKGMQLELFEGTDSRGRIDVDGNGNWTLPVSGLGLGPHIFKTKALYGNNQESNLWGINVYVPLVVDPSDITLSVTHYRKDATPPNPPSGAFAYRAVSGGTPPYTCTSSNPAAVEAVMFNATTVRVISKGSAGSTITVSDSLGQTAAFNVWASNVQMFLPGYNRGNYRDCRAWIQSQGCRVPTEGEWRGLWTNYNHDMGMGSFRNWILDPGGAPVGKKYVINPITLVRFTIMDWGDTPPYPSENADGYGVKAV